MYNHSHSHAMKTIFYIYSETQYQSTKNDGYFHYHCTFIRFDEGFCLLVFGEASLKLNADAR